MSANPLDAAASQHEKSNELTVVNQKIQAIIKSFEYIDDERESIKEVLADIEAAHNIKKSVARKAAKILHKNNREEVEEEEASVYELLEKLSKKSV